MGSLKQNWIQKIIYQDLFPSTKCIKIIQSVNTFLTFILIMITIIGLEQEMDWFILESIK